MPEGENKGKEITIEIKKPELIALLVFSLIILALELNVTMKTPIVFGDEGFHTRLAQLIAQEKNYFAFYPVEGTTLINSGFDRNPLWNLLEAGIFLIFGFSETLVKFLTPFIAVMTGIVIYLLTRRIFDEKIAFMAAILAITIPSFVTYSVLFYTDILLSFYTTLSVLLFVIASKNNSRKYFVLSAVFASLAFLTKAPGLATILFFGLAFLYEMFAEKGRLHLAKRYGPLVLVILVMTSGFFIRNYALYGTPYCYSLPIGKGVSLFSTKGCGINNYNSTNSFSAQNSQTGTEQGVYSMGITNYLDFAFGNIWFVVFGAIAGFLLLLQKKDKTVNMLLLYLAFFLVLFPMITSRAEDTARYSLSWVFLFAVLAGSFFSEIYDKSVKYKYMALAASVLTLVLFYLDFPSTLTLVFSITASIAAIMTAVSFEKYSKYLALSVFGLILLLSFVNFQPKLNTMASIKQFSPDFFQACDWVKTNLPENASLYTIWAHRAIYNCQRNAVSPALLPDLELNGRANDTAKIAGNNGIDYVFVQKFSIDPQNRDLTEMYNLKFVNMLEGDNKTFTKVYENGPGLQQCLQQGGCDGNMIYRINVFA